MVRTMKRCATFIAAAGIATMSTAGILATFAMAEPAQSKAFTVDESAVNTEILLEDAGKHPAGVNSEGRALTYTINSTVPEVPEGRGLTRYSIIDSYNSHEMSGMRITALHLNGELIAEGDYVFERSVPEGQGDANSSMIFSLRETRARTLRAGDVLTATITGEVRPIAAQGGFYDGVVSNTAYTTGETKILDEPGHRTRAFETPEVTATSYFGAVRIGATAAQDAPLKDAVFDLYRSPRQGENACASRDDVQLVRTNITTGKQGYAVVNGLHVTDVQNGTEDIAETYCLVQTSAPKGYIRDVTPYPFTLTKDEVTASNLEVFADTPVAKSIAVSNVAEASNGLSRNSVIGAVVTICIGLLVIASGAYAAHRKKVRG